MVIHVRILKHLELIIWYPDTQYLDCFDIWTLGIRYPDMLQYPDSRNLDFERYRI